MLDQIKSYLFDSINDVVSAADQIVLHPEKDFIRKTHLTMKTTIQAILTMVGNTLATSYLIWTCRSLNLPLFNDVIRLNIMLFKYFLGMLLLRCRLCSRKIKRSLCLQMGHRDQFS